VNYWNEAWETMPHEQLRQAEGEQLGRQLEQIYHTNAYYAEKIDLTASQADGALFGINQARPVKDIARILGNGGTTGHPLCLGYTQTDLEVFNEQHPNLVQETAERIRENLGFRPTIELLEQGTVASNFKTWRLYRAYDGITPN
jgi:hypothetical protein